MSGNMYAGSAEGLCVNCGKRPAAEGITRCAKCNRAKRESEQVARIRNRIKARAGKGDGK